MLCIILNTACAACFQRTWGTQLKGPQQIFPNTTDYTCGGNFSPLTFHPKKVLIPSVCSPSLARELKQAQEGIVKAFERSPTEARVVLFCFVYFIFWRTSNTDQTDLGKWHCVAIRGNPHVCIDRDGFCTDLIYFVPLLENAIKLLFKLTYINLFYLNVSFAFGNGRFNFFQSWYSVGTGLPRDSFIYC